MIVAGVTIPAFTLHMQQPRTPTILGGEFAREGLGENKGAASSANLRAPVIARHERVVFVHLPSFATHPLGRTLPPCDPSGTPSTSRWTGAATIVQSLRTKSCIVTRPRTSAGPMPSSWAG